MNGAVQREFKFDETGTKVCLGSGLLRQTGTLVGQVGRFPAAVVVTDANVAEPYAETVVDSLSGAGIRTDQVVFSPGDRTKSLESAARLYDKLGETGVGRDGLVVGVGGGVVTDLAGFVAGTWLRGVNSVLCPTTLEADIDASLGGKTAVNHPAGKNLIGLFHQPRLVVIDVDCLGTLSDRDWAAGLAESVKHAAIDGEPFFAWHEQHARSLRTRDPAVLVELIDRNIQVKAAAVTADVRDQNDRRALLNFGHTIGHGIEAASEYRLRHGECVALGMLAACRLSEKLGHCGPALVDRVARLLSELSLPTRLELPLDPARIFDCMRSDKKARAGALRFVLVESVGRLAVEPVPDESQIGEVILTLLD